MGYAVGLMGGPERPFLHLLYVIIFSTVLLPVPLLHRITLNAAVSLVTLGGYFLPAPHYLHSPYVPLIISYSICVVSMSAIVGHLVFVLGRENFLQALKIRRQAVDLASHNAHLEERVAARTAELRRLFRHLETAREDERARISRELHDELGQELSALRYALRLTRRRYEQDPGGLAANLTELELLLGRTSTTARDIVTALRPRVLDDLGLAAAAEWLVRRTGERTGATCRLHVDRDGAMAEPPSEAATVAFRILQESLTNVERHAGAQTVEVSLDQRPDALELLMRDDGAGFSPERPGRGMGLMGMRERTLAIGGSLAVESAPGAGTCVRLHLPLAPQAEAAS